MGSVAVLFKVMPEDTETDLEALKESIKTSVDVDDMEEEEVAFGLKAIKFSTVLEDAEGGTDEVERKVSEIEGVRSVQIEDMNRL